MPEKTLPLNKSQLLQAYRKMAQIRAFEDRLHEENATGDIRLFRNDGA